MTISSDTKKVENTYNRLAQVYDLVLGPFENNRRIRVARHNIWELARGNVLEVGIGTGTNIPLYPNNCSFVGMDISANMLEKSADRAKNHHKAIKLIQGDIQNIPFPNEYFDTVIATFVFCLVPDPGRGLSELRRVCKSTGRIILLEHVISQKPLLACLQNILNPITMILIRDHINRDTVSLVKNAGITILEEKKIWGDVVRLIVGKPS